MWRRENTKSKTRIILTNLKPADAWRIPASIEISINLVCLGAEYVFCFVLLLGLDAWLVLVQLTCCLIHTAIQNGSTLANVPIRVHIVHFLQFQVIKWKQANKCWHVDDDVSTVQCTHPWHSTIRNCMMPVHITRGSTSGIHKEPHNKLSLVRLHLTETITTRDIELILRSLLCIEFVDTNYSRCIAQSTYQGLQLV